MWNIHVTFARGVFSFGKQNAFFKYRQKSFKNREFSSRRQNESFSQTKITQRHFTRRHFARSRTQRTQKWGLDNRARTFQKSLHFCFWLFSTLFKFSFKFCFFFHFFFVFLMNYENNFRSNLKGLKRDSNLEFLKKWFSTNLAPEESFGSSWASAVTDIWTERPTDLI